MVLALPRRATVRALAASGSTVAVGDDEGLTVLDVEVRAGQL
jgi:hypothetical protein